MSCARDNKTYDFHGPNGDNYGYALSGNFISGRCQGIGLGDDMINQYHIDSKKWKPNPGMPFLSRNEFNCKNITSSRNTKLPYSGNQNGTLNNFGAGELESLQVSNIDKTLIDDMNFGVPPPGARQRQYDTMGGGGCYSLQCYMMVPKENNKYACCTDGKKSPLSCGPMWCSSDTSNCGTYMKQYCSVGSNVITDSNCWNLFSNDLEMVNKACTNPNDLKTFRDPKCQKFCSTQETVNSGKSGPYFPNCQSTAYSYCNLPANSNKPECACINYNKTDDYKSYINKFPNMINLKPQCWGPPCVQSSGVWSDVMTSTNQSYCPSTLQICNQTVDATQLQVGGAASLAQGCNLSSSTSSGSPIIDSGTTSRSSESAPTSSTTSAPPSLFSFKNSDGSTNLIELGAIGFCCCCCFFILLFLIMQLM